MHAACLQQAAAAANGVAGPLQHQQPRCLSSAKRIRCSATNSKPGAATVKISSKDRTNAENQEQPPQTGVGVLDFLLSRAATYLKRGSVATCLACKGRGTTECPYCQGAGVQTGSHSELKDKLQKATSQMLGGGQKTDWRMTNRCTCCKGSGRILCPSCNGQGVRSPHLIQQNKGSR